MIPGPEFFRGAWFLTGPTASGKTAVGVALTEALGAEIISMDSMALYRGLDHGTAKPTPADRRRVPHHLVDCLDPWQDCTLAHYLHLAAEACADIRARGRAVLFVGGTPLYLKALLHGIFHGPPADLKRRRQWQDQARQHGPAFLYDQLQQVDPVSARRLHPNDLRRVIRALEVYEQTGTPISQLQQQWKTGRQAGEPAGQEARSGLTERDTTRESPRTPDGTACPPTRRLAQSPTPSRISDPRLLPAVFCLSLPRARLYERINQRSDEMFRAGLVDEVRELAALQAPLSRAARQALGYKEVLEYLQGVRGYEETVSLVQQRTRRFAKHQLTWFRALPDCRFVELGGDADPAEVAQTILAAGGLALMGGGWAASGAVKLSGQDGVRALSAAAVRPTSAVSG